MPDPPVISKKGMETMRRLLALVSALGMIGATTGCHSIVCGICDCNIPGHQCCYGPCAYHQMEPAYLCQASAAMEMAAPGMAAPPAATAEPVKNMPTEAGKLPPAEAK